MSLVLSLFLATVEPPALRPPTVNHLAAAALIFCARLGLPPEFIRGLFGPPDGQAQGRIDWRTNPDRYLLWDYTRFGVWVEWEASPFPRTGTGPGIRVEGSIEP